MDTSSGRRSVSMRLFVVCGTWLVVLGLYFMFVRPALLPEDLRYIGTSLGEIHARVPGLERWLHRVFMVMGGFIAAAGILLIVMAKADARRDGRATLIILTIVGILSVGLMSATNFQLDSDFKWFLLIPVIVWILGLVRIYRARSTAGEIDTV